MKVNDPNRYTGATVWDNRVLIPEESEKAIEVSANREEGFIGICEQKEIQDKVFPSEEVSQTKNIECILPVLNISEEDEYIDLPDVTLNDYEDNEEFFDIEVEGDKTEKINQRLYLSNFNSQELEPISVVCENYSDLFYLPTDKLSCTDDKIPFVPESKPVNTQSYRLPYIQWEVIKQGSQKSHDEGIIQPTNTSLALAREKPETNGNYKWQGFTDIIGKGMRTVVDTLYKEDDKTNEFRDKEHGISKLIQDHANTVRSTIQRIDSTIGGIMDNSELLSDTTEYLVDIPKLNGRKIETVLSKIATELEQLEKHLFPFPISLEAKNAQTLLIK